MPIKKKVKIGIASYETQKQRVMAIARGEYKPKADEPKIWFTSIESLAQVLSTQNQELLKVIFETEPESISDLAELSGRKQGNLSRTLKTFERYGLVRMIQAGRMKAPRAVAGAFDVEFDVMPPAFAIDKANNNHTAQ